MLIDNTDRLVGMLNGGGYCYEDGSHVISLANANSLIDIPEEIKKFNKR
jgi:hypothetical protein